MQVKVVATNKGKVINTMINPHGSFGCLLAYYVHVVASPQVMIRMLTIVTSETHNLGATRINQMVQSN
jgi:hypothetical protein